MNRANPEIHVAITAAPREGPPLLERCVGSLSAGGFTGGEIAIFAEPELAIASWVRGSCDVTQHPQRLGEYRNHVFAWARSIERTADFILSVEEDTVFCRRLREFCIALIRRWPAGCGAIHLYTSRFYRHQPRGLSVLSRDEAYDMKAACAILFPRDVLAEVVRYAREVGWRGHFRKTIREPVAQVGTDTFIGESLTWLGYEIRVLRPSLAEHVADYSASGHGGSGGCRCAVEFIGADADPFDAYPSLRP